MAARPKYGNRRTMVEGIAFASQREARRYMYLRLLERAGKIKALVLQPRFRIDFNDAPICTYVADFMYFDNDAKRNIIEDVKGVRTPEYRLKKKMMYAVYGITITEV